MKQDKRIKDNQPKLIFDYNNFVNKSSQLRYYELKNEVKNKIDKISDDVSIAGSSAEEKKYNLLMHYKHLSENFDFNKEKEKYSYDVLLTFTVAIVSIMTAWFSIIGGLISKNFDNLMTSYVASVYALMIIAIAFAVIFCIHANKRKRSIEKESQKYSYYSFYYNELKKYIKEDE